MSGVAPDVAKSSRRGLGLAARVAVALVGLVVVGALGTGLWVRHELYASLPRLEGEQPLPGLSALVTVERDALGVPTVRGASRVDLARATGFLHAQDRFFQMDLLRRRSAGELAEIVGSAAVALDREARAHRFRDVARAAVAAADPDDRALVDAYAEGVNAGLAALGAPPFEYLLLRVDPAPWRAEDTVLVVLAMFIDLQQGGDRLESAYGLMHDVLPPELFSFLAPEGTEWDAPLVGEAFETPAVPGPEVFDLRSAPAGDADAAADLAPPPPPAGSNNWALAGTATAHGAALLANDMHLGLAMPNIWYRVSLAWTDGDETPHRMTGVSLPGTPAVVVGSNTHVAWGFTNSQGDWMDLVVVEVDPDDPGAYRTAEGPRKFERQVETIHVQGAPDETLEIRETVWGPVVDRDHLGRPRALRWVAHDPEALHLSLSRLEESTNLDEAMRLAADAGAPAQNFVCADETGRVGWTILGRIPHRVGFDGRLPESWADGTRGWDGWLAADDYPRVVDPPSGRMWTANTRVVDGDGLDAIGHGHYVLGARARQIRDDLFGIEHATAQDMLDVQLDDRAVFLERWHDLLLDLLDEEALSGRPERDTLRRFVGDWGGHASVDSVGYRAVREFRTQAARVAFAPFVSLLREHDPEFDYFQVWQYEGPLWRLVRERPEHLLDPRHDSWRAALLEAVDATLASLTDDGRPLAEHTWGARNTVRIQHPLSRAVPWLATYLDIPDEPLPGDSNMPRFQSPGAGASERLVVSPGRESEGLFHMPGGQSGHPLSPFYRAGHEAWANGEPTPFLPGPAVHTLRLAPAPR